MRYRVKGVGCLVYGAPCHTHFGDAPSPAPCPNTRAGFRVQSSGFRV